MITLEHAGIPRDHQLPDLDPATLRLLSDQIAAAGDAAHSAAGIVGIHQRRPWLRRSALVAAAAAATVALTAVLLPSPPADAWSATPTLAYADTWARLESACQQQTGVKSTAKAVIVEERGDSNFTVLADANMCLQVSFDGRPSEPASGGSELLPAALPGAGEVQVIHSNVLWSMGHGSMDDPNGVTLTRGYVDTVGRVGPGVENIVIHTVDNGDVTASIDNGWFAAWWPSFEQLPTSMTVTTTTGTYTVHL